MQRSTAIGLLACAPALLATPPPLRAQTLATVRIGGAITSDITPILYAIQSGLFRRMGLDVQIQSTAIGAALASAVAGGTLDIAKSSLMSLILAYDHGLKFKIIAGAGLYSPKYPTTEISVLKTSSIRSPADANGKTVACSSLRGFDQLGMQALIDKGGGTSTTVKFIELPFTEMLPALEQGRVDLADISQPVLAAALETGKLRTLGDPYAGIADRVLIAGWFCTEDFAVRNPATVRRFAEAVRQATKYTNAHYAQTAVVLADYAHIDPDLIRKMRPHGTNATSVDESDIQPAIDAAAKYTYIAHPFPAKAMLLDA